MSEYLIKCSENYLNGVTPSKKESKNDLGYLQLLNIARYTINDIGLESFTGYFQELQYRVNLWTAHILIEYYEINTEINNECIKIIRRYSESSLNSELAKEEQDWLEENGKKYI